MTTPRLNVDPHVFWSTIWIFPKGEEVAPGKTHDFMPVLQVGPPSRESVVEGNRYRDAWRGDKTTQLQWKVMVDRDPLPKL